MTLVKICGVKSLNIALSTAEAGADFIGIMRAKQSKRYISAAEGKTIVDGLRKAGFATRVVGVFVDAATDVINQEPWFDYVQLAGLESPIMQQDLLAPIIRVIHAGESDTLPELQMQVSDWYAAAHILVDANQPGARGGTGTLANWNLATSLTQSASVILAGGLTPENVAQAVKQVQPVGVDVSSGVETDGEKDIRKITSFIHNAKEAEIR